MAYQLHLLFSIIAVLKYVSMQKYLNNVSIIAFLSSGRPFPKKTFQCHSFDHNYWKKVFYSISSHWYYHCTFYLTSAFFPGWYYSFAFKVLLGAGECMPFLPRNCLARMMVFYSFHSMSVLFEQLYKVLLLVQATCF